MNFVENPQVYTNISSFNGNTFHSISSQNSPRVDSKLFSSMSIASLDSKRNVIHDKKIFIDTLDNIEIKLKNINEKLHNTCNIQNFSAKKKSKSILND